MSEWVEKPLHKFADVTMGQSPSANNVFEVECGLPFLQGCAEFGSIFPDPKFYVDPPLKVAQQGSTLISVRAPVGTTNQADQSYGIGRGLAAIKAPSDDATFIRYAVEFNTRFLERRSQGSTFLAINSDDLRGLPIFAPAEPKLRNKIGQVLAVLDTQIEQTEALIAKQENIRQGLIQDLFTRGVDETGQLRPAYEDAPHLYHETELGWLPLEWEVTSLQKLTSKVTSGSRDWAKYYSIQGAVFVRMGNMTRKNIHLSLEEKKYVAPPQSSEGLRTSLQPADLLISITADLGIIGLIPADLGEAYINQHIALVRLEDLDLSEFIGNFLTTAAGQRQFQRYNDAGAKSGMNLPTVMSLKVPSLNTKKESDKITKMINVMDTGIKNLKVESAKIQKQKVGLMRDLLSGDVPVVPLMEEASA